MARAIDEKREDGMVQGHAESMDAPPLVDRLARRGALGPEGYDKALNRELIDAHGTPSGSGTFDSDTAYRDLLDAMATPATQGKYYA